MNATCKKLPIMTRSELNLFRATGEELLIMAITGRADRRTIEQELDLRALLGEGPRRRRTRRTAARIIHSRAA
jgi:hypothetical protein